MWAFITQMICPRIDRLQSFLEILLRKKDEENNSKGYPARIHLIAEVDPDKVQARFISSPSYEFYIFDVKSRTNSGFVDQDVLSDIVLNVESMSCLRSNYLESELFYLVIPHIRLPFPTVHVFLYLQGFNLFLRYWTLVHRLYWTLVAYSFGGPHCQLQFVTRDYWLDIHGPETVIQAMNMKKSNSLKEHEFRFFEDNQIVFLYTCVFWVLLLTFALRTKECSLS